jgi:peptidoglycan hydrolase-like protein with peptidoglycan-binding domain
VTPVIANPARPLAAATVAAPVLIQQVTLGMQGDSVLLLQQTLARLGFFAQTPTGYFGPVTAAGIRAFQSAHALAATGVLDAATLAALNQNAAPATTSASTVSSLQAQISTLLALVQSLQARLAALK